MNADRSLRPFGIDLSMLKEVLAVICNLTSKLSLVREKVAADKCDTRERPKRKKKEKSRKETETK